MAFNPETFLTHTVRSLLVCTSEQCLLWFMFQEKKKKNHQHAAIHLNKSVLFPAGISCCLRIYELDFQGTVLSSKQFSKGQAESH